MREWMPTRKQFVSDLGAGMAVAIVIAVAIWIYSEASDLPWNAVMDFSPWQVATVVLAFVAAVSVIQVFRVSRKGASTPKATHAEESRQTRWIVPTPDDNLVISDGVLWQWDGYLFGNQGGMDGPFCRLDARALEYRPKPPKTVEPRPPSLLGVPGEAKVERGLSPFAFWQGAKGREPMHEDRIGGFDGGTLICPKCNREYGLIELFLADFHGRTIGEARARALQEFQAKGRLKELSKPSTLDTRDSPPR